MSMADNRGARTKRKIASVEMKARVTRWSSDEIADWLTSRPRRRTGGHSASALLGAVIVSTN